MFTAGKSDTNPFDSFFKDSPDSPNDVANQLFKSFYLTSKSQFGKLESAESECSLLTASL